MSEVITLATDTCIEDEDEIMATSIEEILSGFT